MAVAEKLIQSLEKKVADLIELSNQLNKENRQLKLRTAELQRERKELLERQRQAGDFINGSLERLRKIEGAHESNANGNGGDTRQGVSGRLSTRPGS